MNKIRCREVFEDIIFDLDVKNPIGAIASKISENSINAELYRILVTDKDAITLDYILNRYDRYMSPLFLRLFEHYGNLTDVSAKIADIIISKFLIGWSKLAEAVFADYDPIQNYKMVEQQSHEDTGNVTTTTSETVTNKYKGFNASAMNDVSESATDGSITTDTSQTGQKATNELTREGNIGVTSSQQMIESSYALARKNLTDVIYKNIDSVLFMSYYD